MKIKRSLKYGSFSWDDETKTFTIEYKGKSIELNKTYAFSFLRFAFSVAQRNWFRKLDKPKQKKSVKQVIDQFDLPMSGNDISSGTRSEEVFLSRYSK